MHLTSVTEASTTTSKSVWCVWLSRVRESRTDEATCYLGSLLDRASYSSVPGTRFRCHDICENCGLCGTVDFFRNMSPLLFLAAVAARFDADDEDTTPPDSLLAAIAATTDDGSLANDLFVSRFT